MTPTTRAKTAAHYKTILRNTIDRRPSGTRQKIALALGKNKSFVSQITNPVYPSPLPAPVLADAKLQIALVTKRWGHTRSGPFRLLRSDPDGRRALDRGQGKAPVRQIRVDTS